MLELDFVAFSPVSFNKAMNHNRFAKEIEIILSECKYMIINQKYKQPKTVYFSIDDLIICKL